MLSSVSFESPSQLENVDKSAFSYCAALESVSCHSSISVRFGPCFRGLKHQPTIVATDSA
jgi:hypothetical protein